jgi:hypothetical protein
MASSTSRVVARRLVQHALRAVLTNGWIKLRFHEGFHFGFAASRQARRMAAEAGRG